MNQLQAMNAAFDALDLTVGAREPVRVRTARQRQDDLIDDLHGLLRTVEDRCVHIGSQWFDKHYDDFVDHLRAAARLLEPEAMQ